MSIKGNIDLKFGRNNEDDFDMTFSHSDGTSPANCEPHWHDCFELICVQSGMRRVTLDGTEFRLEKGDIAVIPPGVVHSTINLPGESFRAIVYGYTSKLIYTPDISLTNLRYLAPFRKPRPVGEYILRGGEKTEQLRRLIETGGAIFNGNADSRSFSREKAHKSEPLSREKPNYSAYPKSRDPLRVLKMRANILEVHTLLCEIYSIPGRGDLPSYIADAQNYIEDRLPGKISPYDIAAALHMSYSNFCRVVKNELNITPSDLITSMRVDLAEQMLISSPGMSVTECAFAAGFSDTSHFIRRFRQYKGVSPGKLRLTLRDSESSS